MTRAAEILGVRAYGNTAPGEPQGLELEFRYEGKKARLQIEAAFPRSDPETEREAFVAEVRKAAGSLLAAGPDPSRLSRTR